MVKTNLNTSQLQHCAVYTSADISDITELIKDKFVICITDSTVYSLYKSCFPSENIIVLEPDEHTKSFESVNQIIRELIQFESDKQTFLLGIGGGVICDLTGFIASIYMRGVSFGLVPTTLLAQVDASVGGKNGINFDGIKNLIGSINQPEFVFCDTTFLSTLPEQDYISAFAEIVKYALINDAALLQFLESKIEDLLSRNLFALNTVINKTVDIKCEIVECDPYDQNQRMMLNFGHTFGHAIEISSGIRHGEAVSIGMIIAMKISVALGYLSQDILNRSKSVLKSLNLPIETDISIDDCIDVIQFDKKRKGSKIDLVLLKDISVPFIQPIEITSLKSSIQTILLS